MITTYLIEAARGVAIAVTIATMIALAAIGCSVRQDHVRPKGVITHGIPTMQSKVGL